MDYDTYNVITELRSLANVRLSGEWTLNLTEWRDGDFTLVVYHTIDATYPFEAEANDEEQGLPFYRERLRFTTTGEDEGWILHEVVRRTCGETGAFTVHSERVAGYTPGWPAPLEEEEQEEAFEEGNVPPRYPYFGRFA